MDILFDTFQLIGIIFAIVFGVALVAAFLQSYFVRFFDVKREQVLGIISKSEMNQGHGAKFETGLIYFRAMINYKYSFNDTEHTGTRINRFLDSHGSTNKSIADVLLSKYPIGKQVSVHINPNDPSDSCLEIETPKSQQLFVLFLGILSLITGISLFYYKYMK